MHSLEGCELRLSHWGLGSFDERRGITLGLEFIDGNEAIARGAVRAKWDFFASYPITPAPSIMGYMFQLLPAVSGVAIQAEDEIASMGFSIGAAMAGRKAMTSRSPGTGDHDGPEYAADHVAITR